jgi:hypothetical protein
VFCWFGVWGGSVFWGVGVLWGLVFSGVRCLVGFGV